VLARLKRTLRGWPRLYSALQRAYYFARRIIETHVLKTRMLEYLWMLRSPDNCQRQDPQSAHREFLVSQISSHSSVDSLLEIGCGAAPNLLLISESYPDSKLHGIDINSGAIKMGKKLARESGKTNIFLRSGRADDLAEFADKSIDIVISDAVIMYIGPDKIHAFIDEAIRVGRRSIILNEWHSMDGKLHHYHYGHWVHDYEKLFLDHASVRSVSITKIPAEIFGGPGWEEFGCVINITLSTDTALITN
jgi:ubiquinone/menaquinone biosynthesis C-methylase UbiE